MSGAPPPLLSEKSAAAASPQLSAAAAPQSNTSNSNAASQWTSLTNASGQTYWANRATGATQWTNPNETSNASTAPAAAASPSSSAASDSSAGIDVGFDWSKVLDPASGKYYYANRKTFATTWIVPPEIAAQQSRSSSGSSTPNIRSPPPLPVFMTLNSQPAPFNEPPIPPPADYERILDASSNKFYYVHVPTRGVSWTSPEAFRAYEDQERRILNHKILTQSQAQNQNQNQAQNQPPLLPPQTPTSSAAAQSANSNSTASATPSTAPAPLSFSVPSPLPTPAAVTVPFAPAAPSEESSASATVTPVTVRPAVKITVPAPTPTIQLNSPEPNSPTYSSPVAKSNRFPPPITPSLASPAVPLLSTPTSQSIPSSSPSSASVSLSVADHNRAESRSVDLSDRGLLSEDTRPTSASMAPLATGVVVPIPRDARGLPLLPNGLKNEISKFALSGYASEHFRVFKKKSGLMSSRKVTVAEILCWQKASIHKSLLASAKKFSSLAVTAFCLIQNFMGDVPSKKTPTSIAKELIQMGIKTPGLRDEIYSQLCKQTKKNPDMKSTVSGWRLIAYCVNSLQPTRDFQDYLLKYFVDNFVNIDEITVYAPYCYWKLLKTLKDGPGPENSVTLATIESFGSRGVPSSSVTFDLSLEYIVQLQKAEKIEIPQPVILVKLCEAVKSLGGFQMKGIFRIAAQKERVQELRAALEKGDYDALNKFDAHTAADVLKIWLRGLYETIFPSDLYENCLAASDNQQLATAVCNELSGPHYSSLDYLMRFLVELNSLSDITAMNEENLAIVFSQDILREPSASTHRDAIQSNLSLALLNSNKEKNFVKTLLEIWKLKVKNEGN